MNPLSIEEVKNKLSLLPEIEKIVILKKMVSNIPHEYDRIAQTMNVFLEEADNGDNVALNLATDRILGFWFKYDSENPKSF